MSDWRETLFVWRGVVKRDLKEKRSILTWTGAWVGSLNMDIPADSGEWDLLIIC
jgi:hypothetical protein